MWLMYPHAIDRLRVMHFLLVAWRKSMRHNEPADFPVYKQEQLATDSGLSVSTISEIEGLGHLTKVALGDAPPSSRKSIIKVLGLGLKRSQKDIDAILWLYEGELFKPLQEREAPSYLKPLETAEYATDTYLHNHIVELLTKALRVYIPGPVKEDSTVKMIFELDQALGVESDEALLEIESEPGQRLTVTKYPSGLTYPPHIYDYGQWRIPYEQLSDEGKQKRSAVTDKRRQIFSEHLQLYGERSIHSRESLTRYLQPKCKHRLSYEQRVANVRHWIDLLERNEHYEVGLAHEEQELELAIKNTVGAFLTGPAGEIHSLKTQAKDRGIHCGPWFVQWCDDVSIFAFFVDFEQKWTAIPEEWRNRIEIITWLRKSLSHSLTKRRRP